MNKKALKTAFLKTAIYFGIVLITGLVFIASFFIFKTLISLIVIDVIAANGIAMSIILLLVFFSLTVFTIYGDEKQKGE